MTPPAKTFKGAKKYYSQGSIELCRRGSNARGFSTAGHTLKAAQKNAHRARTPPSATSTHTLRRICTTRAIATRLFPAPTAVTSLRYLRRAIKGDPALEADLHQAGYRPRLRYLTERQRRILIFYLG